MNNVRYGDPLYTLQNTMQYSVLQKLQFENPIYNAMLTFLIVSLIGAIIPIFRNLPQYLGILISRINNRTYRISNWFYRKYRGEVYIKSVMIEKITDERQLNPLYQAVSWYLMNQVNLDEELQIKCIIDSKITSQTNMPELLRRVVQDSTRKMMFNGRLIRYRLSASKIEVDSEGDTSHRRNDTIECWTESRHKDDTFLEKFIRTCMDKYGHYVRNKNNKKHVYQNMNGKWEKVCEQMDRMEDTIVLKGDDKRYLMNEVDHFVNNKDWYTSHGFLYSLGILLYGTPGCGKTTLIRYISTRTGRNTHYLRLSQIKGEQDFNKLLKGLDLSNTVLVMEDIDCAGRFVHQRKEEDTESSDSVDSGKDGNIVIINQNPGRSLEKNKKLTLDVLLNILDGILTTPGQIVIMTTNRRDVLDDALIRPGRVDINLELHKCDHRMLMELYSLFYEKDLTIGELELIEDIPEDVYSPAHVLNVFRRYKNDPITGLVSVHSDENANKMRKIEKKYHKKTEKMLSVDGQIEDSLKESIYAPPEPLVSRSMVELPSDKWVSLKN